MAERHIRREDLAGKTIDVHSHVGVGIKAYASLEYPYAQTIEGLYYRQIAGKVDVNVVFPYTGDLFFDLPALREGNNVPAARPLSDAPYAVENRMLMYEIFRHCPELKERFLPFVSVDPARRVQEQIGKLVELEKEFPIYGIKISPVFCQSKLASLLDRGRDFIAFARERDIPFLFHVTPQTDEGYSYAGDAFRIIEKHPDLRYCLAHALCFHKDFLRRADEHPNVWVDTAALKIQRDMVIGNESMDWEKVEADYTDHRTVMRSLAERFPDTIVWGSDSPAYAYICRRKQAEGLYSDFRLKGRYEDEKETLDALPPDLRMKVCNRNTLDFLFGRPA